MDITYFEKTQSLIEWSQELNIKYTTLYNRLYTYNWSINKAFTQPLLEKHSNTTHNSKSVEYQAWLDIKARCLNSNHESYKYYGGRGIKIRSRWKKSFKCFLQDIGKKPGNSFSIDRIDNNGNYQPGNCKWSTQKQQMRNTRSNYLVTYQGKTQCLTAWEQELNFPRQTFRDRINKGWSIEKSFETPVGGKHNL